MSERRSFVRKVLYIAAVAVLFLPLYQISAPATRATAARSGSLGGILAQLRTEYQLSQADLGDIDPASETIKLATLGMRGVAANVLWTKANYYKKTENWTEFGATLEQITKIQPNFISVWQYQGWNLSYNVSVEFDDYRDRYYWVIRGIHFLKDGIKYNEDDPNLLWDIGWFIAQKIGRADEHKQFRQLFKDDDDFHPPLAERSRERRDNWLVGKEWFRTAEDAVYVKGKSLRRHDGRSKSEYVFNSHAPMCQINYAQVIEGEGVLGERARQAWIEGLEDWIDFGNKELYNSAGVRYHLNDAEAYLQDAERRDKELDALAPGLREKIETERRDALPEDLRQALELPAEQLNPMQAGLARDAQEQITVTAIELADQIEAAEPEKGMEAHRLASLVVRAQGKAAVIQSARRTINYDYWKMRCEFEQTPEALDARALTYAAGQSFRDAKLILAKEQYEQALRKWREAIDGYPKMGRDPSLGDDLIEAIQKYRHALDQLDESFPADFPLLDILERHDDENEFRDVIQQLKGGDAPAGVGEDTTEDTTTEADEG